MTRRWLRERRRDPFYRRAKREGYRSRASYKLMELDDKFQLFRPGSRVVDLGCAPGGWSQVAVERVGAEGIVVGVDLAEVEPMEGCVFIVGDMTDPAIQQAVMDETEGHADVVISDMSPNISGAYSTDQARSVHLAETGLAFAERVLRRGGTYVCKVFEGDLFQELLDRARDSFDSVRVSNPAASRAASSEVYVVAKGFRGPSRDRAEREARRAARADLKAQGWTEGEAIGDEAPLRPKREKSGEREPPPPSEADSVDAGRL